MVTSQENVRRELLDWLDAKRRHVRQQVQAMPSAERRRSRLPSGWTPLAAVRHLTLDVERVWLRAVMLSEDLWLPDGYEGWTVPPDLSDDDVLAGYDEECRLSMAAVRDLDLDARPTWWFPGAGDPPYSTLREVLLHVLVETATHAGHLDVARELVDGGQRLVLDTPE